MMRHKNWLAIAFMAIGISLAYSQQTVKENDYTITYNKAKIDLQFDQSNAIITNAIDVNTQKPILVRKEGNGYVLDNLSPAEIIKVEYQTVTQKGTSEHTTYLASPSASSGEINVYFNHAVNTSYSQIQPAVNLGNTLDDMLISYINACQNTLDIAIYNSYSPSTVTGIAGAINAAYARGVQIRVIYDGSTSSAMIPLLNSGIPTLASPNNSSYGIMHNKFVIFDANSSDPNKPYVWTGSTNWTVVQIDGPDRNSVITIQDQALALGYKIEFEEMWGSSTATPDLVNSRFGPYKTDNTPHTYIIGGKTINSYFSPSDNVTSKIISAINSADSDINIATMVLTRTDISNAIISKYNGGLTNLNIVMDTQNPTGNQFETLKAALQTNHVVKFTNSGIMHHKFMVVDNFNSTSDPLVLLGSHNWSSSAENRNDENTLIVHDLNIANQYYQAFAYLYLDAGGVLTLANPEFTTREFKLYPNPTSGLITIDTQNAYALDNVTVSVHDVMGKNVYSNEFPSLVHENITIDSQAAGLYFVTIQSSGKTWHYKVIKE
ncbi:T9SS type A sorting domain-containing protein [Flavobacterium silvisoli]|uniref:phospholipase D n=1 Tax=Flavobacterium silvisoli TaxID=2529433 RepID=A0A4Q9YY12_9FLAO|nr:phospholipase D-like domain-containing protein [Flavobacterium silvisoli]TBX66987.1 T9SS type A sorting domain-containing protein [Flavobacterium silvisoli]